MLYQIWFVYQNLLKKLAVGVSSCGTSGSMFQISTFPVQMSIAKLVSLSNGSNPSDVTHVRIGPYSDPCGGGGDFGMEDSLNPYSLKISCQGVLSSLVKAGLITGFPIFIGLIALIIVSCLLKLHV